MFLRNDRRTYGVLHLIYSPTCRIGCDRGLTWKNSQALHDVHASPQLMASPTASTLLRCSQEGRNEQEIQLSRVVSNKKKFVTVRIPDDTIVALELRCIAISYQARFGLDARILSAASRLFQLNSTKAKGKSFIALFCSFPPDTPLSTTTSHPWFLHITHYLCSSLRRACLVQRTECGKAKLPTLLTQLRQSVRLPQSLP